MIARSIQWLIVNLAGSFGLYFLRYDIAQNQWLSFIATIVLLSWVVFLLTTTNEILKYFGFSFVKKT